MRIFTTEIKKLFSSKIFILMIISVFILNAYLMFRTSFSKENSISDYKKIYSEIKDMSDEEKLIYFDERISNSGKGIYFYNWNIFYELAVECDNIVHYQDFIDNIDLQKKSMTSVSIFSEPDTFNYRNIVRTPEAYDKVRDVVPVFSISKGINIALDNSFSDVLCGIILLFSVSSLMITDREQGISKVIFPLKYGRSHLLFNKLLALALTVFMTVILIYFENLIIAASIYGPGDLSRPIQSLNGFLGCNLKISVAGYIVIYILFKSAALFTIGAVLSLIAVLTKNTVSFFSISSAVIVSEGLLYTLIHPFSVYSIFRNINLVAFTKTDEIFCNYRNINVFNYPIAVIPSSVTAVILISVITSLLTSFIYAKKRNLEFKRIELKLNAVNENRVHSALYYTFYKSLFQQKGILITGIFIFLFGFLNFSFIKKYDVTDVYYQYYASELEGPIDLSTEKFIQKEEQHFAELIKRYDELIESNAGFSTEANDISKKLAPESGFKMIKERYEIIKYKDNAQLFYDTGYKRMLGALGYDDDMKYALVVMLMCIFLISPLIANDNKYQMQSVICSTTSGKKEYYKRNIFLAMLYGLISSLIWLSGYSTMIYQYYGFKGFSAPVQCITSFNSFPVNLKVWQYIAMIYILRAASIIVSSMIMLYISCKSRNVTMAVLINFAIFAIPVIIYLFGADFMVNFGMNPWISANAVINDFSVMHIFLPAIFLLYLIISKRAKKF